MLYQPAHNKFRVDDPAELLAELSRMVPATMVTHGAAGFQSSTLPMLFEPDDGPLGTLRGHLARGNPHWRELAGGETLVIYNGPEAYVSPSWYPEKQRTGKVVPTWNYLTVQAEGTVVLHEDAGWLRAHVTRLVDRHEAGRPAPWSIDDAPAEYLTTQLKAIVGLELRITRLEAKRKLSQNRSRDDVLGTIAGLDAGDAAEQAVAAAMRDELDR